MADGEAGEGDDADGGAHRMDLDEIDGDADAHWDAELATLDALLARTDRALAGAGFSRPSVARPLREPLAYDAAWDEDAKLTAWRAVLGETETLPPVLAAALTLDAWETIAPLQHDFGLGRLLPAAVLRRRGKTRVHLACLNTGLRAIPRERRQAVGPTTQLLARIEAITAAAEVGLKDHDRWLLVRSQLERKLVGRRSTSRLAGLIDLILATPIASAGLIAARLGVTRRAAQSMVAELGLREVTGRGRYRAWGVV